MDIAKALAISASALEVPSADLFRSKMIPPGSVKPKEAEDPDPVTTRRGRRAANPFRADMTPQEVHRSLTASVGVIEVTRSMLSHTIALLR